MLRSILALIAGLVVAIVVVMILEMLGHWLYPPPPGIDLHDPETLKTIIDKLPRGAIIAVLVAWGCGTFAGSWTAALIARRARIIHGLIVGGILMGFGVMTMLMIPHPIWFMLAAGAIFPLASVAGGLVAGLQSPAQPLP